MPKIVKNRAKSICFQAITTLKNPPQSLPSQEDHVIEIEMDLSGKIIGQLPEVGGNSKSGNAWRKQEYILETAGQYPKKVCISIWGDKIDQFGLKVGEQVTLGIDVESREYNGRWYTEVKAYKVDRTQVGGGVPDMPEVDTFYSESDEDKLPF